MMKAPSRNHLGSRLSDRGADGRAFHCEHLALHRATHRAFVSSPTTTPPSAFRYNTVSRSPAAHQNVGQHKNRGAFALGYDQRPTRTMILVLTAARPQEHHRRCAAKLYALPQVQTNTQADRRQVSPGLLGRRHCRRALLFRLEVWMGSVEAVYGTRSGSILPLEYRLYLLALVCRGGDCLRG